MKYTATTLLAGSLLAMTAGAPAFANNNGQSMQNNSSSQQQQSQHKQSQHKNAGGTFTGTIKSVKTVKFSDGKQYVMAKIKNNQGKTSVLNLGTKQNLTHQDANVKKGQQIQASGRSGRVNDKPVLVVYSFKNMGDNGQTGSNNSDQ